jgi:methylated-DNA-[protein]-cysteine S-methyltransferase
LRTSRTKLSPKRLFHYEDLRIKKLMTPSSSLFIARATDTPIGLIEVQAGLNGLMRVDLLGKSSNSRLTKNDALESSDPAGQALHQILEYLAGSRRIFSIEIDWSFLKPFQGQVLKRTLEIPFGAFMTYGQIARELSSAAASRAVGGALAHNPMPIVIPCHRVVAADGSLTGFSAADGIRAKQWLLELEGHRIVSEKLV